MLSFSAVAILLLLICCCCAASFANAAAAASAPLDASQERAENLAFVLTELNRLAALPLSDELASLRPAGSVAPVWRFVAGSPFREESAEVFADVPRLHAVYRQVRGFDEKRRRPVVYKALVHEESWERARVERTVEYVLSVALAAADEAATDDGAQHRPVLTLVASVSRNADGYLAVTTLRSPSGDELALTPMGEQGRRAQLECFHPVPVLLALGGVPALESGSAHPVPALATSTLRVSSANIWNYNYFSLRLGLLSSALSAARADVVGFQEVRSVQSGPAIAGSRWQVSDLSRLGAIDGRFEYASLPAMRFREGKQFVSEGLAIFAAKSMRTVESVLLSRDPEDGADFHQRASLKATLSTPSGSVAVLTTHLSLSLGARARTLPELVAFARRAPSSTTAAGGSAPAIIVGDFNAKYSDGLEVLPSSGFRDAWAQVHGLPGEEDPASWTFHSWDPRSRIDFIFFRGAPAESNPSLSVDSIEILAKEGESLRGEPLPPIGGVADMLDTMFPSDHRFLVAEFTLTPTAATATQQTPTSEQLDAGAAALDAAKMRADILATNPDRPLPLVGGVGLSSVHDEL